jgi:DNA-binding transcriptional MerR regulator
MTGGLRSGEVAAAAGVNLQTLRYYERRGLLADPGRTSGGHRVYSRSAVTMVRVIKAAQRLGFTLDEVAGLLASGGHRHGSRPGASLQRQAAAKLSEVDARIADLHAIPAALEAGCNDLAACAESPRARCRSPSWPKRIRQAQRAPATPPVEPRGDDREHTPDPTDASNCASFESWPGWDCCVRCGGGTQPQRCLGRLHGLVDHGQQFRGEAPARAHRIQHRQLTPGQLMKEVGDHQ